MIFARSLKMLHTHCPSIPTPGKHKNRKNYDKRPYKRVNIDRRTMMELLLNDIVDPNDLKKFRIMYEDQSSRGVPSEKAQFEYAICLVRSKPDMDMKHGIALLEDLFKRTHDTGTKRDCLYYLALGNTRLKHYEEALKFTKLFLQIEPKNHQVQDIQKYVTKKMRNEGLTGMAIVGGAALAVGGLIGLGVALAKK